MIASTVRTSPARAYVVVHGATSLVDSVTAAVAPEVAKTHSRSKRIEPPPSAHSSPAESGALATSAFATASANESIAPPCGTPAARDRFLPASCTVRYGGAFEIMIMRRARIEPNRRERAGQAGRAPDRTSPWS